MSRPKRKVKTVITIETVQRTVIRSYRRQIVAWCERCAAEVLMTAPETAARFGQLTTREIYRRAESGELHFIETNEGELLVCRGSLERNAKVNEISK